MWSSKGVFFIIPCVDVYEKIDMRTATYEIPPQEVEQWYFYDDVYDDYDDWKYDDDDDEACDDDDHDDRDDHGDHDLFHGG